jgi:predicted DNA-binding transcriptional regulator YafY
MGRSGELIRQWTLLQKVAGERANTIPKLAAALGVSTRTIRRDLAALQVAGFPVYDDTINGTRFWRVERKPLARWQAADSPSPSSAPSISAGR